MKEIDLGDFIAISSLLIGLSTTFAAIVFWYVKAEKRKYGLERDFAHLQRNYEQIQQGLNTILQEMDSRFDLTERDILEIKAFLNINKK